MADDLKDVIRDAAGGLKSASGDSGSSEVHPLPDLIAADKHLAGRRAAGNPASFFQRVRLVPPGAV